METRENPDFDTIIAAIKEAEHAFKQATDRLAYKASDEVEVEVERPSFQPLITVLGSNGFDALATDLRENYSQTLNIDFGILIEYFENCRKLSELSDDHLNEGMHELLHYVLCRSGGIFADFDHRACEALQRRFDELKAESDIGRDSTIYKELDLSEDFDFDEFVSKLQSFCEQAEADAKGVIQKMVVLYIKNLCPRDITNSSTSDVGSFIQKLGVINNANTRNLRIIVSFTPEWELSGTQPGEHSGMLHIAFAKQYDPAKFFSILEDFADRIATRISASTSEPSASMDVGRIRRSLREIFAEIPGLGFLARNG
jgi:hypothetical protein